MAAMSSFLETSLLNHLLRSTSYTAPGTVYVALLTTNAVASDTGTTLQGGGGTGVEVSGGNYARQSVAAGTGNWSAPSGGSTSNSNAITWASVTWSATVVGIAICDAATNGNMLFFGALASNKVVSSGDTITFNVSQLAVSLS